MKDFSNAAFSPEIIRAMTLIHVNLLAESIFAQRGKQVRSRFKGWRYRN